MVLRVAEVVEKELADIKLVPHRSAVFQGPFVGQLCERPVTFAQAAIGVIQQLVFAERLLGVVTIPAYSRNRKEGNCALSSWKSMA